ncbi:hypothetical protein IKF74_00305 [Candidatus Saccharibacteria bacterium]|nr:hypothetical protein [Candidatus Saccharibacteria bacterium]
MGNTETLLSPSYKRDRGEVTFRSRTTGLDRPKDVSLGCTGLFLPLSIPMTGNYNWTNGALNNRGYNGNFWSSTGSSETNANNLNFNYNGNFNPQNSNNKVNGLTIRCVAR